jgi:hypothetical protein
MYTQIRACKMRITALSCDDPGHSPLAAKLMRASRRFSALGDALHNACSGSAYSSGSAPGKVLYCCCCCCRWTWIWIGAKFEQIRKFFVEILKFYFFTFTHSNARLDNL